MLPLPDRDALAPATRQALADLNAQALQVMITMLRPGALPRSFALLGEVGDALLGLDEAARRRLAAIPHLLITLHFDDVEWWRAVRHESPRAVALADRAARAARPRLRALAQAMLTLVWHLTRSDPPRAALLLGLSPAVIEELRDWTPSELQRIADRHALRLQPRWPDRAGVWARWIHAVASADPALLRQVSIHGLQLLASRCGEADEVSRDATH